MNVVSHMKGDNWRKCEWVQYFFFLLDHLHSFIRDFNYTSENDRLLREILVLWCFDIKVKYFG